MIRTDWVKTIQGWEESGKSQKQYCQDLGVKYSTFCYHLRKSKEEEQPFQKISLGVIEPKKLFQLTVDQNGKVSVHFNLAIEL